MFKIVASFTRPNANHEFFNDLYMNYEIIKQIHAVAETIPGYLGVDETIYRDEFRCDKALCFENKSAFDKFVNSCQILLLKRKQIIEEYCQQTGQEYKYYIIEDKDNL